jgi:hypothetical protein
MVDRTLEQAGRMGAPRAVALCKNFGGALSFSHGDLDAAERQLREAVDLYAQIGAASGEALSLGRLGALLVAGGRLDEADEVLSRGLLRAEHALMRSHCLTRVYAGLAAQRLAAGDLAAAEQYLLDGEDAARRHGHCLTCNALLLPEAVRVRIAGSRLDLAESAAAELWRLAESSGSRIWRAIAGQARACVLAARGQGAAAAPAFAEAERAFLAAGAHGDATRSAREREALVGGKSLE